jgi:hypothetical protein
VEVNKLLCDKLITARTGHFLSGVTFNVVGETFVEQFSGDLFSTVLKMPVYGSVLFQRLLLHRLSLLQLLSSSLRPSRLLSSPPVLIPLRVLQVFVCEKTLLTDCELLQQTARQSIEGG